MRRSQRDYAGPLVLLLGTMWLWQQASLASADESLPFRTHVIRSDSEYCAAAAIDINSDGKLDIACGAWWYEAPTWQPHRFREVERIGTRFDDYSNLVMDVDHDGDQDIISVNYRSKSIYWVRNPGDGKTNWERVDIDTPGPSETGRLVDVDGDGSLDILPNGTTFAAWYSLEPPQRNAPTPDAKWTKHELPSELAGHGIGFGDINGDGRGDLICPNGWAEAPEDRRQGRWLWHPDYRLPRDGSIPMLVLDVDSDGDQDIVWGRGHNVGLYWTEQRSNTEKRISTIDSQSLALLSDATRDELTGRTPWVTHAIDTSWSCAHAPMTGDLDGDGKIEIIAGKRFQGHEGKDPGENEPLGVFSYQFQPSTRTWQRRVISLHPSCALDLDPKCVDIDADGDLDIIAPARSGLCLIENLRIVGSSPSNAEPDRWTTALPATISHQEFSVIRSISQGKETERRIQSALDMGDRREQIQRQMEVVMGPLPGSIRRAPLDPQIASIEKTDKYTRVKLTYVSEPGQRVPAYLLIPHDLKKPAPAVLCLHPTQFELGKAQIIGLGGKPTRFYAHELAERGFVCLAPDYPGFGEYKVDFAELSKRFDSGTMKAIWDNIRGIDLLESLSCVKPDSIGAVGHSLGGHNALYTAAFDVRVRAVMSSCGFNAFEDYYEGNLKGWTSDRYMPRIASQFNSDPRKMPFDFPEVLAAIAPRPLLVSAPLHDANFAVVGVRKCDTAVKPVYELLGKPDNVKFLYPDCDHDFPDDIRHQVYDWFSEKLR